MRIAVTAIAFAVLALSACTAPPDGPDPTPGVDEPAPEETSVSAIGACDLVTTDELGDIFGTTFSSGRTVQSTVTEDGVTWTPDQCSWESDEKLELSLKIADAADFETGTLVCAEPSRLLYEVTDIADLGTAAYWTFDDAFGAEGELRVCTAEALIDVELEAETGDGATLQGQAVQFARLVTERSD